MTKKSDLEAHLDNVVGAIQQGELVAFLGAGANLCSRPKGMKWCASQKEQLPLGGELADYLADVFGFTGDTTKDLTRVSQHLVLLRGTGPLYKRLHELLDADYPVTPLHRFFAKLPRLLKEKSYPLAVADPARRRLLVVTTNYDDLMERAFLEAGQLFHSVVYAAEGNSRGTFYHLRPGCTESEKIDRPNQYGGLFGDEYPILLKIHGAVDRARPERDSFVITEDHYIEYLARTDVKSLIPTPLPGFLQTRHLLFLGYSLKDWNLRVILHRLWGESTLSWRSWAIQLRSDPLDREFWSRRNVEIIDHPLAEYISCLEERVFSLPPAGGRR